MSAQHSADALISRHEVTHGSRNSYLTGFVLAWLLTIAPFSLVIERAVSGHALIALLLGFAVLQVLVQLVFFLHLGRETKPRWKLVALLFGVFIVLIVVIGSLWIMYNLNYHMRPGNETSQYIMQEEGIPRQ